MDDPSIGAGATGKLSSCWVPSVLHQSVGRDFKLWPHLHMTLSDGGTLNTNAHVADVKSR